MQVLQRSYKIPISKGNINAGITSLNEEATLNAIPTYMVASK